MKDNLYRKAIVIIEDERVIRALQNAQYLFNIIERHMKGERLTPIEFAIYLDHVGEYRIGQPEECIGCEVKSYCDEIASMLKNEGK